MTKLSFVYNADSGLFSLLTDAVHRVVSPATYSCNLCKITYGATGMRDEWRSFIEALGGEIEFLHRDELRQRHGIKDVALPAVFLETTPDAGMSLLVDAVSINAVSSVQELKALVADRLSARKDPVVPA